MQGIKHKKSNSGGTYSKGKKLVEYDDLKGVYLADFSIDENTVIATKRITTKSEFLSLVQIFLQD